MFVDLLGKPRDEQDAVLQRGERGGLRRKAQTICWVAAAVLSAIALVAAIGVHSANTATKPSKAAASPAAASKTSSSLAPSAVAVRVNALPFTRVDFVLLLTGGAMLLAIGSSIRRVRAETSARQ